MLHHVEHGARAPPARELHSRLVHQYLPGIVQSRIVNDVPAWIHVAQHRRSDQTLIVGVVGLVVDFDRPVPALSAGQNQYHQRVTVVPTGKCNVGPAIAVEVTDHRPWGLPGCVVFARELSAVVPVRPLLEIAAVSIQRVFHGRRQIHPPAPISAVVNRRSRLITQAALRACFGEGKSRRDSGQYDNGDGKALMHLQ